jgi:hypothetical protein
MLDTGHLSIPLTPLLLSPLRKYHSAVSGPKTTILIGNEERDKVLQAHFVAALEEHFTVKPIKKKKLCGLEGYHDLVQVWACKKKRCKGEGAGSHQQQQQQQQVSQDESQKQEKEGEDFEEEKETKVAGSEAVVDEAGK